MIILRQDETLSAAIYNNSSGDKLQTVAIVFIAVNTFFVALRWYARHITKAGLGWDDFFLSAGYVFNIGLCITAICPQSPTLSVLINHVGLTSQFSDCPSRRCRTSYIRGREG